MIPFTCLRELEHWSVHVAIEHRLVSLVRTEAPLKSVAAVEASFAEIAQIVGKFPTRSWGLVQDMRNARPAPTPEIESAIRTNRQVVSTLFHRHALVFATAMGVMQAKRMLREAPDPKVGIFLDEVEACAWAADGTTAGAGPRRPGR